MKLNFKGRAKQAGFTLIELIVVIVILGIMAATALPKFLDLGADARLAKAQAGVAAVKSAMAMAQGAGQVQGGGSATASITLGGSSYTLVGGAPSASQIAGMAGLSDDYIISTPTGGSVTITTDSEHDDCGFIYTQFLPTGSGTPASTEDAPATITYLNSGTQAANPAVLDLDDCK